MADYIKTVEFLIGNHRSHDTMEVMWKFMYDKNEKIKQLTDSNIHWYDLNDLAKLDLINRYQKYVYGEC